MNPIERYQRRQLRRAKQRELRMIEERRTVGDLLLRLRRTLGHLGTRDRRTVLEAISAIEELTTRLFEATHPAAAAGAVSITPVVDQDAAEESRP